jgi:hypothetical protein
MDDDVEALVRRRRHEIVREQIECRFADLIRVLTSHISLSKPRLTERVRDIQDMKLVGDACLTYQRAHPATPAHGISREIEDNREILTQNIHNVRSHGSPKPRS